jgi:hypothetical protein
MAPRRAVATVTFENAGTPTMVKLDLVKLPISWRIRDIHAGSGDLRARFEVKRYRCCGRR